MKNKPVILVVDDQLSNLLLLEGFLVRQGYEIIQAESGQEALDKLSENQIDLVLLDVKMPGMSGFEVLTKLRAGKKTQRIPVVMITAQIEKETRVQAYVSGCDDFISKPFEQYELLVRVKSLLRIKFLNDEVEESRTLAENKSAELERFTYTASHDLKSPLITIQSYAGMIQQDLEAGKYGRAQDDLKSIESAAEKMTFLINDLLELSLAGIMRNAPTPIDMNLLVTDCLALLAGSLKQKQVEVVLQTHLPKLFGDSQRLTAVLQNLIENTIKYMGDQVTPRIEIGTRVDAKEIVFFVSDNGVGIDPIHHKTIFGLFNKLDAKSQGTGVGLALVKRIVEVHGGRVWVESEGTGTGSTFCFTLPNS